MAFSLVLLLLIQTYAFSKWKHGKEVVLLPNKLKMDTFFFSKLWLVIFLPIIARVIWSTRAQAPTASSIDAWNDLRYLWTFFATKQWLFAAEMYYIYGKNISLHFSRCENFWELCAIMHFFYSELCELCAQSLIMRFRIRT